MYQPKKIVPPHKRKNDDDVQAASTSTKKIKLSTSREVAEDSHKHYRIVDFIMVFSTIVTLVKCVKCDGNIDFQSCKKEGLGFKIKVTCNTCKNASYVPSSERINSGAYEINYRFAFVMRILGLGFAGCEKFCGLMDLSSNFVVKSVYVSYIKKICSNVEIVAKRFFASAVQEEKAKTCKEKNLEETTELTVSGDGTWTKRRVLSTIWSRYLDRILYW